MFEKQVLPVHHFTSISTLQRLGPIERVEFGIRGLETELGDTGYAAAGATVCIFKPDQLHVAAGLIELGVLDHCLQCSFNL